MRNRNGRYGSLILYICFLVLMVLVIGGKKNFHVDELLTYQLANSMNGYISPADGETYLPGEGAWLEYLTVQKGNGFNYRNVWKNQEADVHPPLYYVLIHTICSFMPGKFSIWQAGWINIIFALLSLWALRCLLYELTQSKNATVGGSVLFILSAGILSSVSFFRMYAMTMFEAIFVTLLFVRAEKRYTWKTYAAIAAVSAAGALTHYYFIIYLFFLCLLFGICLLVHKRLKEAGVFLASMALSGGGICCIISSHDSAHVSGGCGTKEGIHGKSAKRHHLGVWKTAERFLWLY